jgi:hypothetical protein
VADGDGSTSASTLQVPLATGGLSLQQTLVRAPDASLSLRVSPSLVQEGQSMTLAPRVANATVTRAGDVTTLDVQLITASQAVVTTADGSTTLVGSFDLKIVYDASLTVTAEHVEVKAGDPDSIPVGILNAGTSAASSPGDGPATVTTPGAAGSDGEGDVGLPTTSLVVAPPAALSLAPSGSATDGVEESPLDVPPMVGPSPTSAGSGP